MAHHLHLWYGSDIVAVNARGASRGIYTLNDPLQVQLVDSISNTHWLTSKFIDLSNNHVCLLINIYMLAHFLDKKECQASLCHLGDSEKKELCIFGGDFNIALHIGEKKGGLSVRDPFQKKMEDFIYLANLIDIKPLKFKYTWSNKRVCPNHIVARLDIFFYLMSLPSSNYFHHLLHTSLEWIRSLPHSP